MYSVLAFLWFLVPGFVFSLPAATAAPVVLQEFEGLSDADNEAITGGHAHPPDNGLAVGPGHVVQMVNVVGRITDKVGTPASSFSLASAFELPAGFQGSDPRVIYDALSGRWFATYMSYSDSLWSSSIVLAVSMTSDPTGPVCRYRLGNPTSETFKQDYPMVGVSDDKVVVSFHGFYFAPPTFYSAGYYVVNKAQVMACVPSPARERFLTGTSGWKPAQALSSTSTAYMAAHGVSASLVWVRRISGTPGGAPITVSDIFLPITDWWEPQDAVQKGSSVLLDVDRRTQTVVWRDNSLWLGGNGACVPPGDVTTRSCLRLVEVRTDSMSVRQDIVFGSAGRYYFNPAVQLDAHGNLFVVFMASSASEFLSVRAAGRLSTDPLNTLQPPILLRAGEAALTGVPSGAGALRAGDYSGAAVDPVDPFTVWVSSEYTKSTGDWGTYVAELTYPASTLTVAKTGSGSGTVTSSPAAITCGAACSAGFASGTVVTLTTTPAAGSTFAGWAGGGCSGTGACTVTLTATTSVTATFTLTTFSLTVTKTGTGSGTVTSSPAGISCGVTCAASYASGTAVTLTATPSAGSTFAGWSGGGCSGAGACSVTLTAATSVTATFTLVTFSLTVTKAGAGAGTVTSSPAGISCGAACAASYASGTAVTLTATPAANSTFGGWSGAGCSGTGPCTIAMTAAAGVTATFDLSFFTLTVAIAGSADGTVVSNPIGVECGATCAATYAAGTVVTLTATAPSGAAFARWGGACGGTTPSCAVTLDTARAVTATFSKEFTDSAVTATSTLVKAIHIADLRSAIGTLRSHLGLSAFSWTDPALVAGVTTVRAVHLVELRTALAQAYAAAGTAAPTYTDSTLEAGQTVVKRAHLVELRNAVRALE